MLKTGEMLKMQAATGKKKPTFPGNLYILYIFNISREMLKLQIFKLVHLVTRQASHL